MSDRQKRHRRKNVKERVKRFRAKKQKETKYEIQAEVSEPPKLKLGRKRVRRDRSKLYRENLILRKKLNSMQKLVDMHRKRAERAKKKHLKTPDIELTPNSLIAKTVQECFSSGSYKDAKEKVARKLFVHNAMAAAVKSSYRKSTLNEKRQFKQTVSKTLAKYRIVRSSLASYLGLKRGFRNHVMAKEKES